MWPLPNITDACVQIILHQQHLSCFYIDPGQAQAQLNGYRTYIAPIASTTTLHNPTELYGTINTFLSTHKVKHGYLHVIVGSDLIHEQIIAHHTAHLTETLHPEKNDIYQEHQYLGNHEDTFLFYHVCIAQPLLLQLRMLGQQVPMHLQTITAAFQAQLYLYRYIHKQTFNHARLAGEIDQDTPCIPSLFCSDMLRRILTPFYTDINNQDIVYALGCLQGTEK